jgi:hypothetical protein
MKSKSIFILMLATTGFSFAEAKDATANDACLQEAKQLCPELIRNNDLLGCMRSKRDEFSKGCQPTRQEMMANRRVIRACENEIKAVCKDVMPGGGRIIHCLKENEAKLSSSCSDRLK